MKCLKGLGAQIMETKEGTIKSVAITEGRSGKGAWKRWEFSLTDGKKYSTFDDKIGNAGFKSGDNVIIEGEQVDKFWQMRAMSKAGQNKAPHVAVNAVNVNSDRNSSMYVSYAKDIFISLIDKYPDCGKDVKRTMASAIELVKQAKEAL